MKKLSDEFDFFWNKILKGENFAFMRNADGELAIMEGRHVAAQEGNWSSPNHITKLGIAIYESLSLVAGNVYYAVSCPCCDRRAYYWYMSRIQNRRNITFANLWINSNYPRFQVEFPKLRRDAVLIANYRAEGKRIGNLNVLRHYKISDDCISFWEDDAEQMINQIVTDFGDKKNILYVVSAGPMSGPIISALYKKNPDNCYVDFGSSIDPYYRDGITRPYMKKGNVYAKRNCWMFDSKETSFDVTCVCNMYKRPDSLSRQVAALEGQTLKPKEIILYQDGIAGNNYRIELLDSLKSKFSNIRIAEANTGVWERFRFAKDVAKSPYVCVFDDDTIPGERWLENCHFQMLQNEGIYGTNGIVLTNTKDYPEKAFFNVGWHGPVKKTTQVDFVGHSWFFPRKCLDYMFDGTEQFQSLKYVGEDMCLSVKAKEHGVRTFVPPHPCADKSLWGSTPLLGNIFGHSAEALSLNMNNLEKMRGAVAMFIQSGWKPLCLENRKRCRVARIRVLRGRLSELRWALTGRLKRAIGHPARK